MSKNPAQIKSDYTPSSAILNEDDLRLLSGIKAYHESIKEKCAKMLQTAQEKCDELRAQILAESEEYKQTKLLEMDKKLTELSEHLQQENYELLRKFCASVEENIFTICYKIVAKLNLPNVTNSQLLKLIKEELVQYTQDQQITIQVNLVNLDYLKETLTLHNKHINYVLKDSLEPSQCIISDGFTTVYADIHKCADKILFLLNDMVEHNG